MIRRRHWPVSSRAVGFSFALAFAGCGVEPPVPESPTWIDDVEPILRGNCFSCHGSTDKRMDAPRFDVFDPTSAAYQGLGPFLEVSGAGTATVDAMTGTKTFPMALLITTWSTPAGRGTYMPPPPATPLSARDHQVITKWFANKPPARGTRANNAKPTVALRGMPKRVGANVEVEIVVGDADHDQVLGRLACGSATGIIRSTGASKVIIEMAPAGPLSASVSDGQDRADNVMLGACP